MVKSWVWELNLYPKDVGETVRRVSPLYLRAGGPNAPVVEAAYRVGRAKANYIPQERLLVVEVQRSIWGHFVGEPFGHGRRPSRTAMSHSATDSLAVHRTSPLAK